MCKMRGISYGNSKTKMKKAELLQTLKPLYKTTRV